MQERETYINKNGKLTLHSTSIGGRRAKKKKAIQIIIFHLVHEKM